MMDIGNDDLSHASDRTSSSASSTNYDEIFKNGPPKSNVPVNSRRFSGYIELYEYTMELIEQQTLCFAIWSNKEQQLKAATMQPFPKAAAVKVVRPRSADGKKGGKLFFFLSSLRSLPLEARLRLTESAFKSSEGNKQ